MKSKFTAKTIYILFIGLFAFFQTVSAAPGDLDTTFSQDGKIVQQFGRGHYDVGRAAALQADGKIVVVGTVADGYLAVCGIVRYNPDGTLDTTFDVDGKAFVQITHRWTCRAVTIQPDGKIVTVGFTGAGNDNNTGDFAVVRLNSDGSLDTTFDGDGKVITRLSDWRDSANAVAIQPDGKIVAAGFRYSAPRRDGWYVSDFAVVRYNADGSLDTTFNGDGKAFAGFFGYEDIANSMVIQPDGKIVAAGKSSFAGDNNFGLVRFNPDGTLDTTFNGSGKISTNISGLYDIATSAAIQPDGKIIAAGKSGDDYFTLARYNPDGTLDTTFDGDGFAVAPVRNGSDEPTVTAIQADGKIVAAGTGWDSQTNRLNFAILRYNSDGALDSTFDGDGIVSTDLSGEGSWANALVLQPDGKIVATGYIYNGLNNDFAVARYNANGTLDTTFDGDGKTTIDLGIAPSAASAVAIQTNGKIVAAGGSTGGITLVRYNENGALDTSFADGGISSGYFLENNIIVNALTLQTDGKIVAAGSSNNGSNNTDFAVVRFNANGTLDTSFGIDGRTITSFTGGNDGANSIAVQADGKIVAAGYSSYKDFAIARYNADGTLDNTFDGDGRVITPVLDTQDMARSVVIQPDGKIIAAGFAGTNFNQDFAVVRYNPNGSLDSSFDNDGIVITPVLASDDAAWSVALQPDGKIVAAGSSNNVSVRDFAVVRYNPNGSLDTTFDGDGKVTVQTMNEMCFARAVGIQPDGKIVVSGNSADEWDNQFWSSDLKFVRLNSDGSLDPSYGVGGTSKFDLLGDSGDFINGMAIDAQSRAVAVGELNGNFMVVRVLGDSAVAASAPFDFDGDRKTDISIYRPGAGEWWINRSSTGATVAAQFGTATDKIVPGDFTGDGKTDTAVWRPATGEWFVLRSEDNSFYSVPFGSNGDMPVPADFDGDGKTDLAIYRPSTFTWYISKSTGGYQITSFGAAGDIPVTGDYDRDGKSDVATFRPSDGSWWIQKSATNVTVTYQFGNSTDIPVQGDYTGDGRTDSAVWRPSTGEWFILRSEDNSYYSVSFGVTGDIPIPGDYDGDGRFDTAVFRPTDTNWYINRSTTGLLILSFGLGSDRPVPSAFVP